MLHNETKHTDKKAAGKTAEEIQSGVDTHGRAEPFSENKSAGNISAEAPIGDSDFDRSIRDKLPSGVHYSRGHWDILSERLDLIEERISFIYRHKLIETVIMLLLLLSAGNLVDSRKTREGNPDATIFSETGPHADKLLGGEISSDAKAKKRIVVSPSNSNAGQTAPLHFLPAEKAKLASVHSPHPENESSDNNCTIPAEKETARLAGVELKGISNSEGHSILPVNSPAFHKNKDHFALSFVSVASLNRIHTPAEVFLGTAIESYNKYSITGGGGCTISRERKNLSVEAGLIFLSKRYHPNHLSVTGVSSNGILFRETLKTVEVNMLELPLNVTARRAMPNGKTSLYGGIGSTVSIITRANYDNERLYLVPASSLSALGNTQQPSELKKVKDFNTGLFEGGSFSENTYLSAQLLLGLEYRFNPRFSFFNQINVQRQISTRGIGANNNYYHSFSLWLGLKTHF